MNSVIVKGATMEQLGDILKHLRGQAESPASTGMKQNDSALLSIERCPNCHDSLFVRVNVGMEDDRFGKALPCPDCLDTTDTFESFEVVQGSHKAVALAKEYATGKLSTPWLILMGSYGSGKTHLAHAIAYEHKRRLQRTHMAFIPALLQELRDSYEAKDHEQVLARYQVSSLVILDDVGDTGNITPWVKEQMLIILNNRYEGAKPTVITTNNNMEQIGALYGGRIASRMWDTNTGISTVAILDCPDYRTGKRW